MNYESFFKFCEKRHNVYLRRKAGEPWPWTDDVVLQEFSFTNVYRELDKTTVWFRENVRDAVSSPGQEMEAIWATVLFRWFNRIEIGEVLLKANQFDVSKWNDKIARMIIRETYPRGPWATGAYIIKTPEGQDKLSGIISCAEEFFTHLDLVFEWFTTSQKSLEDSTKYLIKFNHLGWFMAYEIVTDLRHTAVLRDAPDIMTWANPGPGATRGAARVLGLDYRTNLLRDKLINIMRDLLAHSKNFPDLPGMEMRDIEHCLCEFDKYERTRLGTGRPRNVFTPPHRRK